MDLPTYLAGAGKPAGLILGLVLLIFYLLAFRRVRAGDRPTLRPIPGYETLRPAVSRAAESNRPLHVSPGAAGLGDSFTAETVAGLTVLEELAQASATAAAPLLVSTASPVVLPIAQEMLRQAYEQAGYPQEYDPTQVRFIAPQRNAYAVGAARLLRQEKVGTSVTVGNFGDEYLLLSEAGAEDKILQVAGTGEAHTLPFMVATARHVLVGEEVFAAGAYLSARPAHLASLMAQDHGRLLVILLILTGVFLATWPAR